MQAVLFDLDGVLIDSYRVWHAVINAFARDHDLPPIGDALMQRGWGQGVDEDAAMFFAGRDPAELEAYYDAHFLEHLESLEITDGADRVFRELRIAGVRSAVVTNTPHDLARRLLERTTFEPDLVVGTSTGLRAKPAPDMLLFACDELGVAGREASMVGDSAFDRDAATAAGIPFLAYRWNGGQRIDELSRVVEIARGAGD